MIYMRLAGGSGHLRCGSVAKLRSLRSSSTCPSVRRSPVDVPSMSAGRDRRRRTARRIWRRTLAGKCRSRAPSPPIRISALALADGADPSIRGATRQAPICAELTRERRGTVRRRVRPG